MSERMWAVDVEGSGKSPPEIVELAIVEMRGLRPAGRKMHWRLRPKHGIAPAAVRIHGIQDADVADAPEFEEIADDVLTWLEGEVIVGHNVRVELDLLGRELGRWVPAGAIDTLRVARRLLPNEERYGLEHLGAVLGLEAAAVEASGGRPHQALYDAVMAALLLGRLLEPLPEPDRSKVIAEADILSDRQGSLL